MSRQVKKLQSLFPDYPRHQEIVAKDGKLDPRWELGLSSLFQSLQKNYKREGLMVPTLTEDQITDIQNTYTHRIGSPLTPGTPDISGQMVYDITNNVPKIFVITYTLGTQNIATAAWKTFTIT